MPKSVASIAERFAELAGAENVFSTFYHVAKHEAIAGPGILIRDHGSLRFPVLNNDLVTVEQNEELDWQKKLRIDGFVWLEPPYITCKNPRWRNTVYLAAEQALRGLGIKGEFELTNERLLLSKMTAQLSLSEKRTIQEGHFANLLIIFPSDCGGWELSLSGHEPDFTESMPEEDIYSSVSCFWLNGKEVNIHQNRGCFVSLLHDLIWQDTQPMPTIDTGVARINETKTLLNQLSDSRSISSKKPGQRFIVHKLSQYYPSFDIQKFTPFDSSTIHAINAACRATEFYEWFVCTRREEEHRVNSYYTHYGWQRNSVDLMDQSQSGSITLITTHSIVPSGTAYQLHDLEFLGEDWFGDTAANSDGELSTDDGFEMQRWKSSAILLVSSEDMPDFVMTHVLDVGKLTKAIQDACDEWQEDTEDASGKAYEEWKQLCDFWINAARSSRDNNYAGLIKTVLDTALSVTPSVGMEIVTHALDLWYPDITKLSPKDYKIIAKATVILGWETVNKMLDRIFPYSDNLLKLHELMQKFTKQYKKYLVQELDVSRGENSIEASREELLANVAEWPQIRLIDKARKADLSTPVNLSSIGKLISKVPLQSRNSLLDAYIESIMSQNFSLGPAVELFEIFSSREPNVISTVQVTRAVVSAICRCLQDEIHVDDFISVIELLGKTSLDHLASLTRFILPSSKMHTKGGTASQWLTYLPRLAELAGARPEFSLHTNVIITTVLAIFLTVEVGPAPLSTGEFQISTIDCSCQFCSQINDFIRSNEEVFDGSDVHWNLETCQHVKDGLKAVPEANLSLDHTLRKAKMSNPHIYVKKVDKIFSDAVKARNRNLTQFNSCMEKVLKSQQCDAPQINLGTLSQPLSNADVDHCTMFLQDVINSSLTFTSFVLQDSIVPEARSQLKNVIEARGGTILSDEDHTHLGETQPATRHTPVTRKVMVILEIAKPDESRLAYEHYHSDDESEPTSVSVNNVQDLINALWCDTMLAGLGFDHQTGTCPENLRNGTKRKASHDEAQPFSETSNSATNAQPLGEGPRKKVRRLGPTYSPAPYFEKENLDSDQILEVVDLT